ncbi:MAG: SpoIIE family protein phosphatase [Spirochaetales bacterium]|nr:SpoIIE family protein phosphatase [Spirochaetales bacterium]
MRRGVLLSIIFLLGLTISSFAQTFYWEEPEVLVPEGVSFSSTALTGDFAVVFWQESRKIDQHISEITLSLRATLDGRSWEEHQQVLGPFHFSGKEVSIFSFQINQRGELLVAVVVENRIEIYHSRDRGMSFSLLSRNEFSETIAAPKLRLKDDGGYILFIGKGSAAEEGERDYRFLSTYYSLSSSGRDWLPFQPLADEAGLELNYLPASISYRGREIVIFQVFHEGRYQLYRKISADGGKTWGMPEALTDSSDGYDNQRPYLKTGDGQLFLTWERGLPGISHQVFFAALDDDVNPPAPGDVEQVSSGFRVCQFPQIIYFNGELSILWFDNRDGPDSIIIARRDGRFWDDEDISGRTGNSSFGRPLIIDGNLHILWENESNDVSRLVFLAPDASVPPPAIIPVDFSAGGRSKQEKYSFRWTEPVDSSGIRGFSYSLDRNPDGVPREKVEKTRDDREHSEFVTGEGQWYFHVRAQDYAGNWSEPATAAFYRDTTPPGTIQFNDPELDEEGYLAANTYALTWDPPTDADVAGYSYKWQYLGPSDSSLEDPASLPALPSRLLSSSPGFSFRNEDNGLWAFSVAAIDTVGNIGDTVTQFLRMNKYIPVTYITMINAPKDDLGRTALRITGRGFSEGGFIQEVIFDVDGKEPYDYIFPFASKQYEVLSDRIIAGPVVEDIQEGDYFIGLIHPVRGTYFTRDTLRFEPAGTIKFGDFTVLEPTRWFPVPGNILRISFNNVLLGMILLLLVIVLIVSIFRITAIVREGIFLRREVHSLITGEVPVSPRERERRIREMKKKGMGLRIKFALFVTLLVFTVVLLLSIPLGVYMISTQQRNLANGLKERTEVLLDSVSTGARNFLRTNDIIELGRLSDQGESFEDVTFVTVTGKTPQDQENADYIWGTSDDRISEKIDTPEYYPGSSRLFDDVTPFIPEISEKIEKSGFEEAGALVARIQELQVLITPLARKVALETATAIEKEQYDVLQDELSTDRDNLNEKLRKIGDIKLSEPAFKVEEMNSAITEYTFFKPVVYRQTTGTGTTYYQGVVRIGITTENIWNEIKRSRTNLILINGGFAFVALLIGIIGALVLAAIIIRPITLLVQGVEVIRDITDQEDLKSHIIKVDTGDEIAELADVVNQMTQGLVNAAIANKDLTVGKEVQKMFIPLEKDPSGRKLTTGIEEAGGASFFGYYEGAKGVSGDYFAYKKLDEKHYAIIKCDVAGKGVPASLIMVQVATIFLNYFQAWSLKEEGIHLERLVYSMNELIEEREFKGRFAALTVLIMNIENGACYICNAGDKLIHYYDNKEKRTKIKELPEAPAAGVFPNMLVEMQAGFQQVTHVLKKDDILFLFTDGIEEAKRYFRNPDFSIRPVPVAEIAAKAGEQPPPGGEDSENTMSDEELGIPRIHAIIDAVLSRSVYRLEKNFSPLPEEELIFDFSTCAGTVEDVVLSMVSVEKIFRINPDPSAGVEDRITVDRKIDTFLKDHFNLYSQYFANPIEEEEKSEYIKFSHLREDGQYDDLTILCIKKN